MSQQLVFKIPPSFIVARVVLTRGEIAYGFRHGWLSREGVVEVTLAKYMAGVALSESEEKLALLLTDDINDVDQLVEDLDVLGESAEERARVWLFLALAWLLEHPNAFGDPLDAIELLYSDFGYPEELRGLVRFLPAQPGDATGVGAIESRWRDFVRARALVYREREGTSR